MPSGRLSRAALLLLAASAALALAACGGGSGPDSKLLTPTPLAGSLDDFRVFAQQVETALKGADAAFFLDRLSPAEDTCSGQEVLGPCAGHGAGPVKGMPTNTWRFVDITFIPEEDYPQQLRTYLAAAHPDLSDQFGDGTLRLAAVTENTTDRIYGAVTTSIIEGESDGQAAPAPEREAHLFKFQFRDDKWILVGQTVAVAVTTAADFLPGGDCAAPEVQSHCPYNIWQPWEETP